MPCEACLTIPPVIKDNYQPKGSYSTIAGLKTYITGPADATTAIVGFYDIFAHIPQTLQGADILSAALNIQVILPDLLQGHYAKVNWYLPTATEKDAKEKAEYFADVFQCRKYLPKLSEFMKAYPKGSITAWGSYGLCWGAKMVSITSGKDTLWNVSAQAHPSELDFAEVKQIEIPHIILASEREDPAVVAECKKFLEGRKSGVVDTYQTQLHGWMAARADLADENVRKEYVRGYTQLAEFFHKHLLN